MELDQTAKRRLDEPVSMSMSLFSVDDLANLISRILFYLIE